MIGINAKDRGTIMQKKYENGLISMFNLGKGKHRCQEISTEAVARREVS